MVLESAPPAKAQMESRGWREEEMREKEAACSAGALGGQQGEAREVLGAPPAALGTGGGGAAAACGAASAPLAADFLVTMTTTNEPGKAVASLTPAAASVTSSGPIHLPI